MKLKRPVDYAVMSCETMMRKYEADKLPPEEWFHYHQGVFLSGMYKTYELTKDERYIAYLKKYVDRYVDESGHVDGLHGLQMDDIQAGNLLYPLIDRYPGPRYENALKQLMGMFDDYPRCKNGGYWHKDHFPWQMWLDGLYMGGPIKAEYGRRYNKPEYITECVKQVKLMREVTRDDTTGLWYHAWDESLQEEWADPVTKHSSEFWGRSIGWVPVAIMDMMDHMDEASAEYTEMTEILVDLLKSIAKYQSKDGRWYQVVNKGGHEGNWLETSCSCLYIAALCKAVRKGFMEKAYLEMTKKGFAAVVKSLKYDGDNIVVNNVCIGTGVMDYRGYCERPTSENDLHGVGAFLIMCTEAERAF